MADEIVCWSDGDDLLSTISDDLLSTMSDNPMPAHQAMTWDPLAGAVYETATSGGSEVDSASQQPSDGESGSRQRAMSGGQQRRGGGRHGKHGVYYHQVKSAALTASQSSVLGSWSGIDPNGALHEEIGEEQSDHVNQMHATIDPRNVHSVLTVSHDSSGRVGSKSEWSFAPAAAPKFMASAAWAGSRAAGAVDVLGGAG
eukprot:CAMPEP_0172181592 /NCGR_PEP_ID=MMETSP1050-20130122/17910_1 /TAXON_ID=233186 /ORGANISM="Cryptomonas curvata, Strain CCAP979/52" /LENGTH=199 /DNA_ID=CAMNT_0012854905 /DNA_START=60 /DNA_END=655 /DNA_ORIENTATION=-